MGTITNFSKTGRALLAMAAVSCGFFCQSIYADPVDGSIAFGGAVKFDAKSLSSATGIKVWKKPFVMLDSGDFAAFAHQGDSVTVSLPWTFKGLSLPPSPWSTDGFEFNLTSSSVDSQSKKFLNITGSGTVSGNGFDLTPGSWSFIAQKGHGTEFSFQAGATAVPEPATILLVGPTMLAGLFYIRRRRS